MEREFMKSFLNNYYADYQSEAVKDSDEYRMLQKKRQEIEDVLEEKLRNSGNDLMQLFDTYLDACSDEMGILMQEIYLLGCHDRERMLRGII